MLKIIKSLLTNFHGIYTAEVVESKDKSAILSPMIKADDIPKTFIYFNFYHKLKNFFDNISVVIYHKYPEFFKNQENLQVNEMEDPPRLRWEFAMLIDDINKVPEEFKSKMKQLDINDISTKLCSMRSISLDDASSNHVCPITNFFLILHTVGNFESSSNSKELISNHLTCYWQWNYHLIRKCLVDHRNDFKTILTEWEKVSREKINLSVKDDSSFYKEKMIESLKKSKELAINLRELIDKLPLYTLAIKIHELYEYNDSLKLFSSLLLCYVNSTYIKCLFTDDSELEKHLSDLLNSSDFNCDEIETIIDLFKSFVDILNIGVDKSGKVFYKHFSYLISCVEYFGLEFSKHNGIVKTINYIFEQCITEIDERIKSFKSLDTNEKYGENGHKEMEITT